MSVTPAAHAEDLVLQVTKAGTTNPNQVAIVPFLGNQTLSDLTLTHLNNTELKAATTTYPTTRRTPKMSSITSMRGATPDIDMWLSVAAIPS